VAQLFASPEAATALPLVCDGGAMMVDVDEAADAMEEEEF
jgi:hypothetical protein